MRRAGLDYWEHVDFEFFESWEKFKLEMHKFGKPFFITKKGDINLWDAKFFSEEKEESEEILLLFGSETFGFDGILDEIQTYPRIFIPVNPDIRSFNLSTAVGIAFWEALRQYYKRDKTPGKL